MEHASSFSRAASSVDGATVVVPMAVVSDFFVKFQRRLAIDPQWWRRNNNAP
jgi:hypothetical protein